MGKIRSFPGSGSVVVFSPSLSLSLFYIPVTCYPVTLLFLFHSSLHFLSPVCEPIHHLTFFSLLLLFHKHFDVVLPKYHQGTRHGMTCKFDREKVSSLGTTTTTKKRNSSFIWLIVQ